MKMYKEMGITSQHKVICFPFLQYYKKKNIGCWSDLSEPFHLLKKRPRNLSNNLFVVVASVPENFIRYVLVLQFILHSAWSYMLAIVPTLPNNFVWKLRKQKYIKTTATSTRWDLHSLPTMYICMLKEHAYSLSGIQSNRPVTLTQLKLGSWWMHKNYCESSGVKLTA